MENLLSYTYEELQSLLTSLGQPKFRAAQIFPQLHRGLAPEEMTNVGKAACAALAEVAEYRLPKIRRKLVSAIDGTVKYLFELYDGNCIESVVMNYKHGYTICVSSQVGCRMGCKFCASTIGGRIRNLEAGEILGQIIAAQKDLFGFSQKDGEGERISNVVMMGIGEPLDNYENVIKFLRIVSCEQGINIGCRHISLSTCGIAEKIPVLAKEDFPVTLSISLHAADDETRSSIMPINNRYRIDQLLAACKQWFEITGRRISFEYTLISGKNDSPEQALKLADLLNSRLRSRESTMPIHVNLIPVNEVSETGFVRSDDRAIANFAAVLEKHGVRATVRRKLGSDINASCGQLRKEVGEVAQRETF